MKLKVTALTMALLFMFSFGVFAQSGTHTVKSGDSMWKIAVQYQIGITELLQANPQIKNPAMIVPGQKINVPSLDDVKKLEEEVARLVNLERSKRGLQTLTMNWELSRCARYKSQDFINKNYFNHNSPTYGTPFDMMKSFGLRYSAAGENIAKFQRTPSEVMNSWMNSAGHKANILSATYNQIGVGVAKDSKGNLYWTQMFIKKY